MNIFILDYDRKKSAQYHCDKHINKMILEGTQMLCTVLHKFGKSAPYKPTYMNHPCTLWVERSLSNWRWLRNFVVDLDKERFLRLGNLYTSHKSATVAIELPEPNINDIGLTSFVQTMPDKYKSDDVVIAYRKYYRCEKKNFATWKNRPVPFFMLNN
jgi:hypothetical protein